MASRGSLRCKAAEAVTEASVIVNVAGVFRIRLDLLPEMPDVTPDVPDLAGILRPPNFLHQILRRHDISGVVHKVTNSLNSVGVRARADRRAIHA